MLKTTTSSAANTSASISRRYLGLGFVLCLITVLLVLFHSSLSPGSVHFSNDGPLGADVAYMAQLPSMFVGYWLDLYWLGAGGGCASVNFTNCLLWLLGPVGFAKFFPPFTLFLLGLGAWIFFRSLKLSPLACALGGIAAALNSDFFSISCWGVGPQSICVGLNFLALAALTSPGTRMWLKAILAGFAVGMGVIEGADVGAIFSLCTAAACVYSSLINENSWPKRVGFGIARVGMVAAFAMLVASQAISTLVGTSIKGMVGTQQDSQTKAERWDWATQWSLPKTEIVGVIIPGLFGNRMDTPDGGQYWGTVGRTPGWEQHHQGTPRYSGGGFYAGLLVVIGAAFALCQSFRKQGSPFTPTDRKWIWFWAALAFISVLLAFGRHAPFYQFIFALPFFSTIRNPAKFLHPFTWALLVLFAYGLHGMSKCYLGQAAARTTKWFQGFERKWTLGLLAFTGLSLFGAVIYANSSQPLERYLLNNGFNVTDAKQIIGFSVHAFAVYVLFLILTVAAVIMVMRGTFAGTRAKWAGVWLGLLLTVDLARADAPWIIYWDYPVKYASNPVIDFLRQKPYEHRVVIAPFRINDTLSLLQNIYHVEWMQHHFPYYNVQSLDIVQEPRVAVEDQTYRSVWTNTNTVARWQPGNPIVREWELTNVRYVLGLAGTFVDALNQQLDPARHRFRQAMAFTFPNYPNDFTVVRTNDAGPFALIEFTGALPRVKLCARWQVSTNDQSMLDQLADPAFDPTQTVLVASNIPAPAATNAVKIEPVEFVAEQYRPAHFVLKTKADGATVLLVNDKYDPAWNAWVDGQPAPVLRCNYLMRGVALPAGEHTVEFRFQPSIKALYVSLAALALGILLVGYLLVAKPPKPEASQALTSRSGVAR